MHGQDRSQAPDTRLATYGQVGFAVRRVTLDSPWEWLAAGWRDLRAVPLMSLAYGIVFTLGGWLLVTTLNRLEMIALIPIFAGGFVLIAPLLAAGLYEVSRLLEKGQPVTLGTVISGVAPATGRLGLFGVALFLGFFAWIELAFLLLSLFSGRQRCRIRPSSCIRFSSRMRALRCCSPGRCVEPFWPPWCSPCRASPRRSCWRRTSMP